ncbi:hypothetical protein, partial [Escherichia coli]|uniref:hypothetical protein n=1 Tax=Escherichia coli TaxID=562 RepID=UPI001A8D30B4
MRKAEKKPDLPASLKTGRIPPSKPLQKRHGAFKNVRMHIHAIRIKNAFLMHFRGIYGGRVIHCQNGPVLSPA